MHFQLEFVKDKI